MRYPEDQEASAEIMRRILPRLARHGSGFHPPSYTIWYEYVSGCNPPLGQALDARLAKDSPLTPEETLALYSTYIAPREARILEQLSTRLQGTLQEFGQLAKTAGSGALEYQRSLENIGGQLDPQLGVETLREIIRALATETQRAQHSNQALGERLEATQREFVGLKSQLEIVRNETLLDPLTGLANRRGFQRRIDETLAESPDGLSGCALLIADIDHFKKLNDLHGHLLGDKVLQAVSQVLLSRVKGRDLAARYGGEEFAILLPDTPTNGAMVLAEQIRSTVARGRIHRADRGDLIGSVTISLGVAGYRPGDTLEQWIDRADRAMYQSKRNGRNRVTLAAEDLS